MATYVFRDGQFVDKRTGEPMLAPGNDTVACPQYMPDIPHYASPVGGEMITSRSQRREDLKRNNCIEAGDLPRLNDGYMRSEKFARKHNLPWEGDR